MTSASKPKLTTSASTFRMECGVEIELHAKVERVWSLLTDAADFPRWNSTVTQIEGAIALGNKLKLRVPISERTFTPKVTELETNKRMVWSDGAAPMFKGTRTFTLEETGEGSCRFSMVEVFAGLMLPLIKGSLPDFGPSFERYATDLKKEAESA